MNERIKELAEQAGFCGTGFHNTLPGTTHEDAIKNLAELLIRECARVASDYDGAHYVGTAIEQHFGVE